MKLVFSFFEEKHEWVSVVRRETPASAAGPKATVRIKLVYLICVYFLKRNENSSRENFVWMSLFVFCESKKIDEI